MKKYVFGHPFETGAVVAEIPAEPAGAAIPYFTVSGNTLTCPLDPAARVYGLGPTVRGINKRGWIYEHFNLDVNSHTEEKTGLYGSQNFLMVDGKSRFALFVDTPGKVVFDIGYTDLNTMTVTVPDGDFTLYLWEDDTLRGLVAGLRRLTGRPYVPPRWAFGFNQSRWAYHDAEEVREIVRAYREKDMPIDMVTLDLDYMQDFKDFTVNEERFPNFKDFNRELAEDGVRLVPIIDAGVKAQKGYPVYDECMKNGYYCTKPDGTPFELGVWPGLCVFPDFLNPEAAAWFGRQYHYLTEQGVCGFWNDMNEPAIFYTKESLPAFFGKVAEWRADELDDTEFPQFNALLSGLKHSPSYYRDFCHNVDGKRYVNEKVHNIFGFRMTKAASDGLRELSPDKRLLLFSRSSYIGMHRYGGIWYGDNHAWWSHLLMNVKQAASANMSGFLYSGTDLAGFHFNTTEDLALRWLEFGIFSPLMRNHSTRNVRRQEYFRFGNEKAFRGMLKLRYALLPFLYSEFMRAVLSDGMFFLPLGFVWENDLRATRTEDQLMVGDGVMIAPVYEQNVEGRYVYLPEQMRLFRFRAPGDFDTEVLEKGDHYIPCALDEVLIFLRKGYALPMASAEGVKSTRDVDFTRLTALKFDDAPVTYTLYDDGGETRELSMEKFAKDLTF